jgi:hypothetical protein
MLGGESTIIETIIQGKLRYDLYWNIKILSDLYISDVDTFQEETQMIVIYLRTLDINV